MAEFFHFVPGGITHLYDFNREPTSNANGLAVEDSVSGAHGVVLGMGGSFTGSRVRLPGGASATAAYVDLPNGLLSQNSANNGGTGELTFEGWVRVTGNRTWSRILDFGSSLVGGVGSEVTGPGGGGDGGDYLFLGAQINVDTASRRLELRNEDPPGGGIATADYSTATFNQETHFALTWNESTGDIIAYENGALTTSLLVDDAMSDINDVNVWLGRSNWAADQNLEGEFDSFRVYNRVLTVEQLANNSALGPNHNFSALSFLNPTADNFELLEPEQEQIHVFVDTQTIFDLDISGSSCLSYESSDPNVLTVDANGLVTAVGTGMAEVTTRFAGLEEVLFFSVTGLLKVQITPTELGYQLRLLNAMPGTEYLILRASEVTGPYDTVVGMGIAPGSGILVVEDTEPPVDQAFYRAEAVE